MSNNLPPNVNAILASFVGKVTEFRGKTYEFVNWRREDTYAVLTTQAKEHLNIPFQFLHEVKILGAPSINFTETPQEEVEAFVPQLQTTPPESAEVTVLQDTPNLMFSDLSKLGMDVLRQLKAKNIKAEEADVIFKGMEAMVKLGALQIRALEVTHAIKSKPI